MSTHELKTFLGTYEWAGDWQDLPWSHDEPTLFLAEICRRRPPGRALDIGCGAGTDSVFLAQQGWEVTSLDFVPKALEFTQQRAADAGVSVTAVEADITTWQPPHEYDLVLDHGLLHNMDPVRHDAYREVLMKTFAPDGEFVLLHWHHLYPGQPDGKMGPTRRSRDEIKAFFAPEFHERYFAIEHFESLPTMVGGGMAQAIYWFRRNKSWHDPAGLLKQIRETLEANGKNAESLLAAADSTTVDDGLLGAILGPGRLGLRHIPTSAEEVSSVLQEWAERTGVTPDDVRRLLTVFASEELGGICMVDARCSDCSVSYCKRLRQR